MYTKSSVRPTECHRGVGIATLVIKDNEQGHIVGHTVFQLLRRTEQTRAQT